MGTPPGGAFGGFQQNLGQQLVAEQAERTATSALKKALGAAADDGVGFKDALKQALSVSARYGGRPVPTYGQNTAQELAEAIEEARGYVATTMSEAEAAALLTRLEAEIKAEAAE